MTRRPDPLHNLADALSEDIVATPAGALVDEAAGEPGGDSLVVAFDRIATRAAAQSRRRGLVARLRALAPVWPGPIGWRSAMAAAAGIFVVVIAGGLYFQDERFRTASSPTTSEQAEAPATPLRQNGSMSGPVVADRAAKPDDAPVVRQMPVAAPPLAAPAPSPAPPAGGGVADGSKRMRSAEVRPDAAAPEPLARAARKVAPPEDRLAKLAATLEQQQSGTTSQPPSAAAVAPGTSSSGFGFRVRPAEILDFVWPVRGRVIAGFGSPVGGVPNRGIDLAVAAGADIRAADDGVVIYAGDELEGFGNLLLLRHRDGFLTAYAHAQSFAVKPGDTVRRGQVIAKVGQTGGVAAPQLHYEIRKDNAPVDPAQYLPPPG